MELIYAYIGDIGRNINNIGFNFSPKFVCSFIEGELIIEPKDCNAPKNYYGDKIENCNLVLGENGAGKSTLFALLGKTSYEKKDEFVFGEHSWFIVYHKENNLFLVEGWGKGFINNLQMNSLLQVKEDYSVLVESTNKSLKCLGLYDSESMDALILYANNEKKYFFNTYSKYRDNSDYGFHVKRHRLEYGYEILYSLLASQHFKKLGNINAKNIELKFYFRRKFFYGMDEKDLILYKSEITLISELQSKVLVPQLYSANDLEENNKILKQYSNKEKFVLNFLELSIADFWSAFRESEFTQNNKLENFSKIENLVYSHLYEERKSYLYSVIDILFQNYNEHALKGKSNSELYKKIVKTFEDCNELVIKQDIPDEFLIKTDNDSSPKVIEFLRLYDEIIRLGERGDFPNGIGSFLKCDMPGLSSGERSLVNMQASIMYAIRINENNNYKKYIIVLDEPDTNLHPEWARRFVSTLTELLNLSENIKKVDIFISSHSPFMATDFFKERILKIDIKNGKRTIANADFGILSNIGSIIKNDFFLEYPFGEYAKKKLFDYRDKISKGNFSEHDKRDIELYLNSIGEPIIQAALRDEFTKNSGAKKQSKKDIQSKIKYYQDKLLKIEEGEND